MDFHGSDREHLPTWRVLGCDTLVSVSPRLPVQPEWTGLEDRISFVQWEVEKEVLFLLPGPGPNTPAGWCGGYRLGKQAASRTSVTGRKAGGWVGEGCRGPHCSLMAGVFLLW